MATLLTCPVCGTPPVPDARFCHACGVPLDAARLATPSEEGAERRVVTVLFGDLSDFTAWAEDLDPERVGEVTDRVLVALARAVADVGGHVDKLTGDGIMAVFGAPTAHEDDVERAVRAAAAMQASVQQLVAEESGGGRRLGLRVGLNTGEVLAGVRASLAYTVVGDTVNTASRLSDAAAVGAVYAGRDTAVATMTVASWRTLLPLRLKGKREPVPAYELVGLRPAGAAGLGVGDEAPLVGRDEQLARMIATALDVLERSRPATLLLSGEPGVGKTRLTQELLRFMGELPDARLLWGRATPFGTARHLSPLVDVVRTACGIVDGDDPADVADRVNRTVNRLESRVGAVPAALTDRLLGLLGLPSQLDAAHDGASVADSPPRDTALDGVAALLRALAAEGPVCVVLDDLQWATPELRSTLAGLGRRLRGPILLVLVSRDSMPTSGLPRPTMVKLRPLDESAAERLLRAYLGGGEFQATARNALLGRARGNPYFLAELLHLLVDRGLLVRDGDEWTLPAGGLPHDVLPAGVHAVLAARVDALDPPDKAALRTAAVLGVTFPLAALAELEGRSVRAVRRSLDVLAARHLMRPPDGDREWWAFVHPMAREVAYAALPKVERARRHARAARWAAVALEGSPLEVDGFVAGQAERALELASSMRLAETDPVWEVRAVAFGALLRLGQAALARDEHRQAATLLRTAMSLPVDDAPGRVAGGLALGEALTSLGELGEAETALTAALRSEDRTTAISATIVLGTIRQRQGRDVEAVQVLVLALSRALEAGDDARAGYAARALGLVDYYAGRLRDAEHRLQQALDLSRKVADRRGAGWALQHLAWSATTRGNYPRADHFLADALALFASLDDAGGLAWCGATESLVRVLQGRLHEARRVAAGQLPRAEEIADGWGIGMCLTVDSLAAAELGDVGASRRRAERALATFRGMRDTWGESLSLVALAASARAVGNLPSTARHLREAVRIADRSSHPMTGTLALINLGLVRLEQGDVTAADEAARRATAALETLDLETHATLGACVLSAQVARARGDYTGAIGMLREALAGEDAPTLLFPRRQALAHLAGSLLDAGELDEAVVVARQAVSAEAEDVRSRAVAYRALGRILAARGEVTEAREALQQALTISRSTEAIFEAAATERALATLTS